MWSLFSYILVRIRLKNASRIHSKIIFGMNMVKKTDWRNYNLLKTWIIWSLVWSYYFVLYIHVIYEDTVGANILFYFQTSTFSVNFVNLKLSRNYGKLICFLQNWMKLRPFFDHNLWLDIITYVYSMTMINFLLVLFKGVEFSSSHYNKIL